MNGSCSKCRETGKCIVSKHQLQDVEVGERVTIHFAASGIGPMSMSGTLGEKYRDGDSHVYLKRTDGFSLIPVQDI